MSLRTRSMLIVLAALMALPITAMAQTNSVEITPFAGYRLGGEFSGYDDFRDDFFDLGLEIEDGESFGVIVGFPINRDFQIEVFWSRQESELIFDGGLFDPEELVFELDTEYLHGGFLYQWGSGQVRPFVVGSAGITRFSPNGGVEATEEDRFSVGLGGGVKIFFNNNFGIRLEGRGFGTFVDDDEAFCDRFGCYETDEYFTQTEFRAGLILAF
ncbi:MAG: outer membrane beta-barrel protein [Acidobacteriota bacterium]